MARFLRPIIWSKRPNGTRPEASASPERGTPTRAGHIGPIRREIIFEPMPAEPAPTEPAPVESPPVAPEPQPREPVPDP